MGKIDKLKERFLSKPKDFSWGELSRLLGDLGYRETQSGKTSGSRVKFIHDDFAPISLHKPHPKPVLKSYQLTQILAALKDRGQL
jgi:hypothetical protein